MINVEKLSEVIGSKISVSLSMNHDEEEVLAYGAFVLIQTIISIIMVAIFGIVFNILIEALVISFTASILRKFSGGAHATSSMNCALIGMIIFGVLSLFVKHYVMNMGFLYLAVSVIISFVFTFFIMYKYSPVGTATKPLKNENTRKHLRIKSIKFVLSLFIANLFFIIIYLQTKQIYLLNIAICTSVGVVWQSITMVSLGHIIIDKMDKVLGSTNKLIRRYLHDIGKIQISKDILIKRSKLTDEEWNILKTHPENGVEILSIADCFDPIIVQEFIKMLETNRDRLDIV